MKSLPLILLYSCLPLCHAQGYLEPGHCLPALNDNYKNTQSLVEPTTKSDHLNPKNWTSPLNEYRKDTESVLAAAFAPDVVFRVQVYPSFLPEWAVGLRKMDNSYQLFYIAAKQAVWGASTLKAYESGKYMGMDKKPIPPPEDLKKEYPLGYKGIATDDYAIPIDEKTAEQILVTFKTIILSAQKPPRPQNGFDGVNYVFEERYSDGWIAAHTWSPKPDSYAESCTNFAYLIRSVALREKDAALLIPALRLSKNSPEN